MSFPWKRQSMLRFQPWWWLTMGPRLRGDDIHLLACHARMNCETVC